MRVASVLWHLVRILFGLFFIYALIMVLVRHGGRNPPATSLQPRTSFGPWTGLVHEPLDHDNDGDRWVGHVVSSRATARPRADLTLQSCAPSACGASELGAWGACMTGAPVSEGADTE